MSFTLLLQYLIPKGILSRLAAKIANCRCAWIKNFIIKKYCAFYHIDMSEALEPNCLNYLTFNDFFTRALREDARFIDYRPQAIIAPVDGKIWQIGEVDAYGITAKGRGFTLEQLLADTGSAAQFKRASFTVLYLAPDNYHRVHMPLAGRLRAMRYIPGSLFSVNPCIVNHIPNVFARNERVVTIFDTVLGPLAIIFVGAMIVGSIETLWSGVVCPRQQKKLVTWDYSEKNISFERGSEIGRFKFGSTVILLAPEKTIAWDKHLEPNVPIKMGQSLGFFEASN